MVRKQLKKILLLSLFLTITFFLYHFAIYANKVRFLKKQYSYAILASEVSSFISYRFEATGRLVDKKQLVKYLTLFSPYTELFKDNNYHLEIDRNTNRVLLYAYGPSGKDNRLKNKINLNLYVNRDGNYKQNFTFWNYLKYGDYDFVVIDNTFFYNCHEVMNNMIFINEEDNLMTTSPEISKIQNKFKSLLNQINLIDGVKFRKYPSKRAVYIYDGKQLKNMCPNTGFVLGKEREKKLFKLIKENFSDYSYIKFSVSEKEDDN